MAAKIFEKMPFGSHLYIVGVLSGEPIPVNTTNVLFQNKTLSNLLLYTWIALTPDEERQKAYQKVSDDLRDGGKIFGSDIIKEMSLSQWHEALE